MLQFTGKRSRARNDPNYVPSIFEFTKRTEAEDTKKKARYERLQNRRNRATESNVSAVIPLQIAANVGVQTDPTVLTDAATQTVQLTDTPMHLQELLKENMRLEEKILQTERERGSLRKVNTQLKEETEQEIGCLCKQTTQLQEKLVQVKSPVARMKGDNDQTHFYTGLPSYAVFNSLLSLLSQMISAQSTGCCLSAGDQLLLLLIKLRLALPHQDLAYRFGIHVTKVTKVFHCLLDITSRELNCLIHWPDRGMIRRSLPECFKQQYCRTTCIIDCSEVYIERQTSLLARAQTYSNYKSHNTVKFLVAISPTGAVTFVSKCWGGRTSDKHLTAHSGFLDHLKYGDLVLADRGFDIAEDLALHGAALAIPPYTKGKFQLSQREVETSRALSRVRIHVERAIGRIKRYRILQLTLPISLIKRPYETDYSTIDKILIVCAALSNLHPPLINT